MNQKNYYDFDKDRIRLRDMYQYLALNDVNVYFIGDILTHSVSLNIDIATDYLEPEKLILKDLKP